MPRKSTRRLFQPKPKRKSAYGTQPLQQTDYASSSSDSLAVPLPVTEVLMDHSDCGEIANETVQSARSVVPHPVSEILVDHSYCGEIVNETGQSASSVVPQPVSEVLVDHSYCDEIVNETCQSASSAVPQPISEVLVDHSYCDEIVNETCQSASSAVPQPISEVLVDHSYCDEIVNETCQSASSAVPQPICEVLVDHSCCDIVNETGQSASSVVPQPVSEVVVDHSSCGEILDENVQSHTTSQPIPPVCNPEIFKDCIPHLKRKLSGLWKVLDCDTNTLTILMFAGEPYCIVQRTLAVDNCFKVTATIHGKELPAVHRIYEEIKKFNLQCQVPEDLALEISKIVSCYRQYEVCRGIQRPELDVFCQKSEVCFRDENPFKDARYTTTWRSTLCHLAIPQRQSYCAECHHLIRMFSKKPHKNPNISPSGRVKTPHRFKPFIRLSTPEKRARMARLSKDIHNLKQVNQRLRYKIDVLQRKLQDEGVDVGEDLSSSLTECPTPR